MNVWSPIHTSEVFFKKWETTVFVTYKKKRKFFLRKLKEIMRWKASVLKKIIKKNPPTTPLCHWFYPLNWKARIIRKQLNHEKIAISFWSGIYRKGFIKYHWIQRKYRATISHLCKGNRSLQNHIEHASW